MSNYKQRVAVAKGREKIIFLAFITWKIRSYVRSTLKYILNKLYCSILNTQQKIYCNLNITKQKKS